MECTECGYNFVDAFCPRCDPDPAGHSVSPEAGLAALPAIRGGDQRRAALPYLALAAVAAVVALGGLALALYRIGQVGPPLTRSGLDAIDATRTLATVLLRVAALSGAATVWAALTWVLPVLRHNRAAGAGRYADTAFAAAGAGAARGWRSPQVSALLLRVFLIAMFGTLLITLASITLRSDMAVNPQSALGWDAMWFLAQLVDGVAALAVIVAVVPYRQWRISEQAVAEPMV
jgi:hypothetical protein